MKTYYIVERFDEDRRKYWSAHRRGIRTAFNVFNYTNQVVVSFTSVKECKKRLVYKANPIKPKIIEVVCI